jgi:hypothetical protein
MMFLLGRFRVDLVQIAVGIDIVVNWNDVIRQTGRRRFRAHKGYHSSISSALHADRTSVDMSPHVGMQAAFAPSLCN